MICPAASPVRDIPLNCAFSPLCFWKCAVLCDLKYKKMNHSLEHIKKTFRCDKNVTVYQKLCALCIFSLNLNSFILTCSAKMSSK